MQLKELMNLGTIRKFRDDLRKFERILEVQNSESCCCGVTLSQCHTLMELNDIRTITLNELSQRLELNKSTVSRTVESLVRSELVSRENPAENRRIAVIALTEKGRAVCKQINDGNDQYFRKILSVVPRLELPVFLNSFSKVVHTMIEEDSNENYT